MLDSKAIPDCQECRFHRERVERLARTSGPRSLRLLKELNDWENHRAMAHPKDAPAGRH